MAEEVPEVTGVSIVEIERVLKKKGNFAVSVMVLSDGSISRTNAQ